jgi:hypothetical protein
VFERSLKDRQPRTGGQLPVFDAKVSMRMGFGANLRSAELHDKRFCCWVPFCFGEHIFAQQQLLPVLSNPEMSLKGVGE